MMMSGKFYWKIQAEKLDPRIREILDSVVGEYAGTVLALTDEGDIAITKVGEVGDVGKIGEVRDEIKNGGW